jgi:diacylglycerol kinase family enzyme
MSLRQRFQAWSRAKRGDHVPHRDIEVTRLKTISISSASTMLLKIDGNRIGYVRDIRLEVVPDEWFVSVPKGVNSDLEANELSDPKL